MDKLTAIIVEDVQAARDNLRSMLEDFCPNVEITGSAETVLQGAKLIQNQLPDILFLDIELGNDTAFDLLDILPDLPSQIIFTTGSKEYALKAFRYAAIDYLLKPIDPDELVEAVNKSSQNSTSKDQMQILNERIGKHAGPSRIALHTMDRMFIIDIKDILRCEADGNYTKFFIQNRSPILVTRTLKEFHQLLGDSGFLRVHQSHLVNTSRISEFVKVDGGYIVMHDKTKVPVSTRKRSYVVQHLERI